jgi:hypothetical protein
VNEDAHFDEFRRKKTRHFAKERNIKISTYN